MNKVTNEEIMKILKLDYNFIKSKIPEEKLLGIFVYGKVNYGIAQHPSDVTTTAMYLPTFEQMCLNPHAKTEGYTYGQRMVTVKDFRLSHRTAFHANSDIQALYTEYYIINPKYEDIYFNDLRYYRDEIAYSNFQNKLVDMARKGMFAQDPADIIRYWYTCNMYKNFEPFEKCLMFNTMAEYAYSNRSHFVQNNWQTIKQDFTDILDAYEETLTPPLRQPKVDKAILNIMQVSAAADNAVHDFVSALTDTEKQALKILISQSKTSQNIVIAVLLKTFNISRIVYNNLLTKLKLNQMADIENHGVKGIHIEFLYPELVSMFETQKNEETE